ncbi:MAG: TonB-dependent receptor [Bacteroidales bacterium]|nr:TonB-dependent receptor [Bacteroidales bacterium]
MKKFLFLMPLLALSLMAGAQDKTVTGQVVGDDGFPIPGAAVLIQGTSKGTVTDADGKYTISVSDSDVLIYSAMGYKESLESVSGRKLVNVVLVTDSKVLDDAVVIGYGTQKKSDLTGSVGIVSMDEILSPAISSPDQALQGRIAGVDILSGGGEPGEAASIRIRGTRSISAGNEPLIVVDGVMDAVESFSDINPDDIKNITVLKDASSTAIYGARGSNGVIIVTTKGGSTGSKVAVTLTASVGMSELPCKLDIMDATEFAQFRNDYKFTAGNVGGSDPQVSDKYPFEDPSVYGKGTDWQDVLTRRAFQQEYKIALNYGDSKMHSYASFGYEKRDGIVIGTSMEKYSALLKLDRKIFKWLKVGARVNFGYRRNDRNSVTINGVSNGSAVCLSPLVGPEDAWNRYSDEGGSGGAVYNSPYLIAKNTINYVNIKYTNLSPWVEIYPFKGAVLKSLFSASWTDNDAYYYSPASMPLATVRKTGGTASRTTDDRTAMLSETTLTWKKVFDRSHNLEIMAGFTAGRKTTDYKYTRGTGYLDDNVGPYNMGALLDKRNLTERSSLSEITRMSALGRINYAYKGRYHITATARYDGSSNFAAGHKWGFFPAAAFRWTVSNEPWMAAAKAGGLTNLSLRLSAGRSGNDAISSYVSQQALTSEYATWLFGETQQLSTYPTRLDNASLTWEKTDSYNAGLDVSLWNDRVTLTADAYYSDTKDLLLKVQNPKQTGFADRWANVGSTRGWGWELTISSRNIVRQDFSWRTDLTLSHNNSVVTDIGAEYEQVATYTKSSQMLYGYKVGYPVNALWGYKFGGVWHNDTEREDNKATRAYVSYQDKNGYAKYADVNHDGILDYRDQIYLGSADPILFGGMQNTFTWKQLTLGVYFTYSIGGYIYNLSEINLSSGVSNTNKYRYMLDSWHPVRNPGSDIPGAYMVDGYCSDRYVHDASYLRLKTLSLSYVLDLSRKVKWCRDITFSAHADNVFLLSRYNGFDPDISSSSSVRRLDNATYPSPRTYMFSIKFRY